MRELTAKDIQVLDSAHLPLEQRMTVERHWTEQDGGVLPKTSHIALTAVVLYSITAFMLLVNFFPSFKPFANIARLLIWCGLIILIPLLTVLMMAGTIALRGKDPAQLLSRHHIFLIGNRPFLRYSGVLIDIVLVCATAAAGYMITAGFLFFALLFTEIMQGVVKNTVRANLKELAERELGGLKRAKAVYQ